MDRLLRILLCFLGLVLAGPALPQAQEPEDETGGASAEVEESDEAYRRRMELEDARQHNLGYTLPPESYAAKQEKLDKLPEESRDNIRDQLVDIIVENGDWEPSDALKDYPYEPTAAARADPELMQQEQEAWDEQIEKYHKREAAAFGTYLGPVPGPGNPDGAEGQDGQAEGSEGSGPGGGPQSGGQSASAKEGEQGSEDANQAAAGTYEPYQSNRGSSEEAVSTAGVQQSALDFLKSMQGPAASQTAGSTSGTPAQGSPSQSAAESPDTQAAADPSRQESATGQSTEEAQAADESVEMDLETPGIIPIEDLEKLEGADSPAET
jgi:hypothetical protein